MPGQGIPPHHSNRQCIQLGQFAVDIRPDLFRLHITTKNAECLVKVFHHTIVIDNVSSIFAFAGTVYSGNGLQQGVFLQRLVQIQGADDRRIPAGQQHIGDNQQANIVDLGRVVIVQAFIAIRLLEQLID